MFKRLLVFPSVMILPTKRVYNTTSQYGKVDIGRACRPKMQAAGGACGEDACLVSRISDNKLLLAVADGVGGWRKHGVDPSLFSNQLMSCLQSSLPSYSGSLVDLLKKAFWQLVDLNYTGKTVTPGSSTACLAVIDISEMTLEWCNVGDSGVMVLRESSSGGYQVVHKSVSQQTAFNAPLQLTLRPGRPVGQVLDPTGQAECKTIQIHRGDCVILATDGLLDNLFPEEIVEIVKEMDTKKERAQRIAEGLVHAAHRASVRHDTNTPFSVEAQRAGKFHVGGKPDDITVLVGIVE